MRLIDADKLIMALNDYALTEAPDERECAGERRISSAVYSAIQNCMKAVEEQPTAFDVEKVTDEILRASCIARPMGWNRKRDKKVQARTHKKKRINKKWAKRYGFKTYENQLLENGQMIVMGREIYMNERTYKALKKHVR